MYRSLGLDLPGCAQLLHVTERTLHNWESGKHEIPFAAYKLLRLLNRMDLPGDSWAGWCFHGGKLWTPEGRSFVGTDGSWWSLLVRRAACFDSMFQRTGQLEKALIALEVDRRVSPTSEPPVALYGLDAARPAGGGPARGEQPAGREVSGPPAPVRGAARSAGPNLLIVHFPTQQDVFGANAGPYAINPVAKTTYSLVAANNCTVKGAA